MKTSYVAPTIAKKRSPRWPRPTEGLNPGATGRDLGNEIQHFRYYYQPFLCGPGATRPFCFSYELTCLTSSYVCSATLTGLNFGLLRSPTGHDLPT